METFHCQCGNCLYFENSQCFSCNRKVGYLPDEKQLSALDLLEEDNFLALLNNRYYRQCKNHIDYNVCNWMVPVTDEQVFCASCRLNRTIPDLSKGNNLVLWYRTEQAKRRLLHSLYSLSLPVVSWLNNPDKGLSFEFLQEEVADEFDELTIKRSIATGHNSGVITINLLEAEHGSRLAMRDKMNERYRTLLGHFRHESGHYYWEYLINKTNRIDRFRELFGDERLDYQQSLRNHYNHGAPSYWQDVWISAYASSHAWEDWAETWAHYLHMVDTIDTAHSFGFIIHGHTVSASTLSRQNHTALVSFSALFDDWNRLSVALNTLNRSMGMDDAYPFVISNTSFNKLQYVHQIIHEASNPS